MPHEFPITDTPRYREIADKFGMIAARAGHLRMPTCTSRCPAASSPIRVSNRLRPWLPLLLALTRQLGGLPQHRHRLRQLAQRRVGALAQRRSAAAFRLRRRVRRGGADAASTPGAVLDDGMVYWDVRPSAKFPTIEVRVADVPATVAETVLLATLIRASVMTALDDERRGEPTCRR